MMTKKDIFKQKLKGEPINVLAANFPIMRELLIECGVCEDYGAQYQITCRYPLNIWMSDGMKFKIDQMQPGDIYWWA